MSILFIEYDLIKKNNTIDKLRNELDDLIIQISDPVNPRIEQLQIALELLTRLPKQQDINTYLDKVNNAMYQKLWSKMFPYHQYHKICEYLDQHFTSHKHLDKIKQEMSRLVDTKLLNSSKYVQYNTESCKITKLGGVIIDENGNISRKHL